MADQGGAIRESLALGEVYDHARQQQGNSELLDGLVSDPRRWTPTACRAPRRGCRDGNPPRGGLRILQNKASADEVEAYKGFVIALAEAAAKAHREGGFLVSAPKEISQREQRALDEISSTLASRPS